MDEFKLIWIYLTYLDDVSSESVGLLREPSLMLTISVNNKLDDSHRERLTSLYLLVRNQLFQGKLRIFFSLSKQPSPNR